MRAGGRHEDLSHRPRGRRDAGAVGARGIDGGRGTRTPRRSAGLHHRADRVAHAGGQGLRRSRGSRSRPSLLRHRQTAGGAQERRAAPHRQAVQGLHRAAVLAPGLRAEARRRPARPHAPAAGRSRGQGEAGMIAWMIYATLVALALSAAAFTAERAARVRRKATRWVWLMAMLGSLALPALISSVTLRLPGMLRSGAMPPPVVLRDATSIPMPALLMPL